jgi:hypothetical protein
MINQHLETTEIQDEPEDCIAKAIYLLQLCQMDLNMGRKELIYVRARNAVQYCLRLQEDGACMLKLAEDCIIK